MDSSLRLNKMAARMDKTEPTQIKSLSRKRLRELRHRAQSLVEGATDPWELGEEYEAPIPEDDEEEFVDEETAEVAEEVIEYTNMVRELIAETILGYLWWSLILSLPAMIWFYPLNELEISGYEAFALTALSPIFVGFGPMLKFAQSVPGLALLRILSLIGVASFQAPTTLTRLIILAAGCGTAMLWFCGMLWSKDAKERTLSFWGLVLGFFVMLVLRILYVTVNPVFSDATSNMILVALGVVAIMDRAYTSYSSQSTPPTPLQYDSRIPGPGWVLVSLGFGALLFITHTVFGEVSLICRWAVKGYPNTGPMPNPWGTAVLSTLSIGVLLSIYKWTSSLWWWALGAVGVVLLYFAPTYVSLAGGMVFSVYVMSVWPAMIDRVFSRPPARTVSLGMLIYIVLMLASVWVVAYNFVPGGEFTRERTHVLLAITMVLIGLALQTKSEPELKAIIGKMKKEDLSSPDEKPAVSAQVARKVSRRGYPQYNCVAFPKVDGDEFLFFRTHVKPVLLCIVLVGVAILMARYHKLQYKTPVKEDPRVFSAMIWTVHFGYDNLGWPSFERAAQLVNETGADVIGFLESDCSKPFLGNHDLAMWFEERLGLFVDFGPATKDHTWGATLLSKYPIVKSLHHLLPSPEGELAPAISATVNISSNLVDFVIVHMGNDRDNLDRKLQAETLAHIMDVSPNPVVFLGYVTSSPDSRDYITLTKKGRTKDIDVTDRNRWCEYIMYRGLTRLGYARISHGGLSDTEVQMAKFRIPKQGEKYKDNTRITTDDSKVPQWQRFPERFGRHYNGHYHPWKHHYHMSTPKYFLPS